MNDTNQLDISKIFADPNQPRQHFNKQELLELKESIKAKGIYVPLTIESNYNGDNYLLLDGERRYRCAKELDLKTVPVSIITGPLSFEERTILRFHIQEQHKNWTLFDKAKAIFDLKVETKLNINELALKLNKHPSEIHYWISLVDISEKTQERLIEEKISFTYLIHIVRIIKNYLLYLEENKEDIENKVIDKILSEKMNSYDLKKWSTLVSSDEQMKEKISFLNENISFEEFIKTIKENKEKEITEVFREMISIKEKISKILNEKHNISDDELFSLNSLSRILKEYENLHTIKK
jgi:ParB family chromosome partitioning protein